MILLAINISSNQKREYLRTTTDAVTYDHLVFNNHN